MFPKQVYYVFIILPGCTFSSVKKVKVETGSLILAEEPITLSLAFWARLMCNAMEGPPLLSHSEPVNLHCSR